MSSWERFWPNTRIAPSLALSVSSARISRSSDGAMSLCHASFAAARTASQQGLGGSMTARQIVCIACASSTSTETFKKPSRSPRLSASTRCPATRITGSL